MRTKNKQGRSKKLQIITRIVAVTCLCCRLCVLAVEYDRTYYLYSSRFPQSAFFDYKPLSGKLFDIDPQKVRGIYMDQLDDRRYTMRLDIYFPERIEEVAELLNSYRFYFWIPVLNERAFPIRGRMVNVVSDVLPGGSTHMQQDVVLWLNDDGTLYYRGIIYFSSPRVWREMEKLREKYNENRYVHID